MISPLIHTDFAQSQHMRHGFFTRLGGVSTSIYASLNASIGSGDTAEAMIENRRRVQDYMQAQHLLSPYQEHGSHCITVTQAWRDNDRPKGDALVTDQPGIALSILTADCAPVLFHCPRPDHATPVIAAAHAGWRGAFGGVLENTIEAILGYEGTALENIHACIGPCIGVKSYEVSTDFRDNILSESPDNASVFTQDPLHFNLRAYAEHRLQHAGLTHIHHIDRDTYIEEELFFSYRRTTHRQEPDYGRQISAVAILET